MPRVAFTDGDALAEHRDAAYEAAVAAYAVGGDPADLSAALAALGYTAAEIQWHVEHPGRGMRVGYA